MFYAAGTGNSCCKIYHHAKKNELLTLYFMWKFRCHDNKSFNALKEDSRKGDFKELKDRKKKKINLEIALGDE